MSSILIPRTTTHLLLRTSTPLILRPALHQIQLRSLASSSNPVRAHAASTALLEDVKQAEDHRGQPEGRESVSDSGPGSEGAHYKNTKLIPSPQTWDLASQATTGSWTLSSPIYTEEELNSVKVVHREAKTVGDKLAYRMVKLARKLFDLATFYHHKPIPPELVKPGNSPHTIEQLRQGGYILSDKQWLARILFLESIAGVPGMVGGVLRHLRSLRLMRRDGGWIHTLLAEAENERMHLLTFLTVKQPSIFFRAAVLGAQGVFFNLFFLTYMFSPKAAHRFVGYLEEEACLTYTKCIEDMERGLVPEWEDYKAPDIAIDYWRLKENATLLDVIKAVRSDEAQHRFVNHTLANLDQQRDFNPFAIREPDGKIKGEMVEFTREQAAEFAREAQEEAGRLREGMEIEIEKQQGSEKEAAIKA